MFDLLQTFTAFFEEWLVTSDTGKGHLKEIVSGLQSVPQARPIQPQVLPVVERWLPDILAEDPPEHCSAVMTQLGRRYRELRWVALPDAIVGGVFANQFAITQLIGPSIFDDHASPFASPTIAAGFSLQAPGLFYPPHHHSSAEYYGILSGIGEWQIYYNRPMFHPPGAHIYHPPMAPHAMRSDDEPLLLIWAWYGDGSEPIIDPAEGWL